MSKIRKKDIPKQLPLKEQVDIDDHVGSGKDNHVFRLGSLMTAKGYVVKIDHKPSVVEAARLAETGTGRERAYNGVRYKKNKYDILKHFLGDFIPTSNFVLTQEGEGASKRYVEMTVQEEVPQYKLSDLTEEQKSNPTLKKNVSALMDRMQYMYRVLGETNARVSQSAQLDAKLDLGGVSDAVRGEEVDHVFSDTEVDGIIHTNKSPNLLVDPATMHVYCIDFDQGQWNDGMSNAKEIAFNIDARLRTNHAADQLGPLLIPPVMGNQAA